MSAPSSNAVDGATVMRPSAKSQRQAAIASGLAEAIDDQDIEKPGSDGRAGDKPDYQGLLAGFRLDHGAIPTLVVGAAPLLALAHSLRTPKAEPDAGALRAAAVAAVRDYERDLAGSRIAPERSRAAHYVVCATIDDIVLSQPWGVRSGWALSGLVSTFHMDVTGGDRVFDLLDHFHRNPGANKDLLLLIYLCLSLGFEGRTRVSSRGTLEMMQIRDGLYRTLRGQFGAFERELSPNWRGENARHKPLRPLTALWTLLGLLAIALALGYLVFTFALNSRSDGTLAGFAGLPSSPPSLAVRSQPPKPTEPAIVSAPVKPEAVDRPPQPDALDGFVAFLRPEVAAGLVALTQKDGSVLVRISNAGLFDSGSAEIKPAFRDLLNRIGSAIAADKFKAVVIGHSDNRPIRTIQYPSNWHLSEARARSVATLLTALAGPDVITFEGRADTEPVADNATDGGREANRRTEILVLGAAAQAGFRPR